MTELQEEKVWGLFFSIILLTHHGTLLLLLGLDVCVSLWRKLLGRHTWLQIQAMFSSKIYQ